MLKKVQQVSRTIILISLILDCKGFVWDGQASGWENLLPFTHEKYKILQRNATFPCTEMIVLDSVSVILLHVHSFTNF
jgi:hypothetical protein